MTLPETHAMGTSCRLAVLTPEQMRRLDTSALEVLEGVGVAVPSERARAALSAAGAVVEGVVARFPPQLVRRLVALAPETITLGARTAAPLVTGRRPLMTTDGCCVEIYDLESGEKRDTVAGAARCTSEFAGPGPAASRHLQIDLSPMPSQMRDGEIAAGSRAASVAALTQDCPATLRHRWILRDDQG
jgi:hypothetical protein